ncbi:n-acetylglutamate synthase [Paenibacillus sp. N1-5-1-14]|uniref:n-acetylglutamate synthase n=1 Tax=Paenibacillus radicibacter TaxID=2972488 RepID=UPI002158A3FB|nr:n-acetylglutamate synthase [Paenibacillus radicibacter]MCR8644445.1 n-acetylglutamate synthase [Paenibacillus radicibacter]
MNPIHYDGKIFRIAQNTENGEVNQETIFKYRQEGNRVWAEYAGGGIVVGSLVAVVDDHGKLDMRYHHINEHNELMTGKCESTPELLPSGKLRLHEEWEWTCRDCSKGSSIVEEI